MGPSTILSLENPKTKPPKPQLKDAVSREERRRKRKGGAWGSPKNLNEFGSRGLLPKFRFCQSRTFQASTLALSAWEVAQCA
mmetsp:Transcript_33404/g.50523  ORF Transcript_33404/g.50523 Transcript_33404/m.50523 type:complete len:82 (+) Transcript_33404:148-393(+)